MDVPIYLDVFIAPIRDSEVAKVLLIAVMLLTFADVFFGILNALVHKDFQSSKMREGIAHKSTTAGAILVGRIIDGTITAGRIAARDVREVEPAVQGFAAVPASGGGPCRDGISRNGGR